MVPKTRGSFALALPGLLLKLALSLPVLCTPLLGVWVSSSLAAYSNGSLTLALLSGLALFPLLPLLWEALSAWRRKRRQLTAPRILTLWDRFLLRTLTVNLLFLGALLSAKPQLAFRALSTRGDWMLDDQHQPWAETTRKVLFYTADHLEWLYTSTNENPFRDQDQAPTVKPPPQKPAPKPSVPTIENTPATQEAPRPDLTNAAQTPSVDSPWSASAPIDPLVLSIPAEVETDYTSVAKYLASKAKDPFHKVKLIHDYVADRVAYDVPVLRTRIFPPQDAETVFRTRMAVCAGYAKLFKAMAEAAGIEVAYLTGDARSESHAWNAVKLSARWHLLDVTWDAGSVNGEDFKKQYSSEYLFTPPEIFVLKHFPDDSAWQLLETPVARGDFLRQPDLSPDFFAQGFTLLTPDRSQITVEASVEVTLKNTKNKFVLADYKTKEGSELTRCQTEQGSTVTIVCELPSSGEYEVILFSSDEQYNATRWAP
jgi:hypothetical protein